MAHAKKFRTAKEYHIQVDIMDSCGKTGLWSLDAQAVFPLSTDEGQQKTGKRPTERATTVMNMH